jgi:polyisoprenoid-binding protein YceI
VAATETTPTRTGTWTLDPVHSSIGFEIAYLGGTFRGEFRDASAELTVDGETASLEGTAQAASVDVKDENLSAHLQSPEFFDVERFPTLHVVARDLPLGADGVRAEGQVTIRGVTRPVAIEGTATGPFVDAFGRERITLDLAATVDRTAFGLEWNMPLPTGEPALANEVTIVADLKLVKDD